jgi:type III secretory pathway component EscT
LFKKKYTERKIYSKLYVLKEAIVISSFTVVIHEKYFPQNCHKQHNVSCIVLCVIDGKRMYVGLLCGWLFGCEFYELQKLNILTLIIF